MVLTAILAFSMGFIFGCIWNAKPGPGPNVVEEPEYPQLRKV
jgi:hypothetical protein